MNSLNDYSTFQQEPQPQPIYSYRKKFWKLRPMDHAVLPIAYKHTMAFNNSRPSYYLTLYLREQLACLRIINGGVRPRFKKLSKFTRNKQLLVWRQIYELTKPSTKVLVNRLSPRRLRRLRSLRGKNLRNLRKWESWVQGKVERDLDYKDFSLDLRDYKQRYLSRVKPLVLSKRFYRIWSYDRLYGWLCAGDDERFFELVHKGQEWIHKGQELGSKSQEFSHKGQEFVYKGRDWFYKKSQTLIHKGQEWVQKGKKWIQKRQNWIHKKQIDNDQTQTFVPTRVIHKKNALAFQVFPLPEQSESRFSDLFSVPNPVLRPVKNSTQNPKRKLKRLEKRKRLLRKKLARLNRRNILTLGKDERVSFGKLGTNQAKLILVHSEDLTDQRDPRINEFSYFYLIRGKVKVKHKRLLTSLFMYANKLYILKPKVRSYIDRDRLPTPQQLKWAIRKRNLRNYRIRKTIKKARIKRKQLLKPYNFTKEQKLGSGICLSYFSRDKARARYHELLIQKPFYFRPDSNDSIEPIVYTVLRNYLHNNFFIRSNSTTQVPYRFKRLRDRIEFQNLNLISMRAGDFVNLSTASRPTPNLSEQLEATNLGKRGEQYFQFRYIITKRKIRKAAKYLIYKGSSLYRQYLSTYVRRGVYYTKPAIQILQEGENRLRIMLDKRIKPIVRGLLKWEIMKENQRWKGLIRKVLSLFPVPQKTKSLKRRQFLKEVKARSRARIRVRVHGDNEFLQQMKDWCQKLRSEHLYLKIFNSNEIQQYNKIKNQKVTVKPSFNLISYYQRKIQALERTRNLQEVEQLLLSLMIRYNAFDENYVEAIDAIKQAGVDLFGNKLKKSEIQFLDKIRRHYGEPLPFEEIRDFDDIQPFLEPSKPKVKKTPKDEPDLIILIEQQNKKNKAIEIERPITNEIPKQRTIKDEFEIRQLPVELPWQREERKAREKRNKEIPKENKNTIKTFKQMIRKYNPADFN